MWNSNTVGKFLADKKVEPEIANAIKARMAQVADANGNFEAAKLEMVMDNAALVIAFEQWWDDATVAWVAP